MNWTEVNIFTSADGIEPVCGCLLNIGITGFAIRDSKDFEEFLSNKTGNWDYIDDDLMGLKNCETCVTVYLPENSQGADMLSSVKNEMSELKKRDFENKFGRLAVELSNVKEEDWANNWKQYFKPLTIGEKLVIKPSWETYENSDNKIVLEIDPASSFGTGQHNTTQLCLELLEKNLDKNNKLLDIGCGSGILSIAGILLGAESACAVDIDLNSVKTAKDNAVKNNIEDSKYSAHYGNILTDSSLCEKIGSGYDIITANIVADVLIAMSPLFKSFIKPNGILILSGIISERSSEVISAMNDNGYTLIEMREKDGWAAVSFN